MHSTDACVYVCVLLFSLSSFILYKYATCLCWFQSSFVSLLALHVLVL